MLIFQLMLIFLYVRIALDKKIFDLEKSKLQYIKDKIF